MMCVNKFKEVTSIIDVYKIEGAFTGEQKKVIYSIMSSKQVEKAKKAILDIDPNAVISIMDVTEAHGQGFKQLSF